MAKHAVDLGIRTTSKQYEEVCKDRDKTRGPHKEMRQFMKSSKMKNTTQGSKRTMEGILAL